jgi:hypothetical protein
MCPTIRHRQFKKKLVVRYMYVLLHTICKCFFYCTHLPHTGFRGHRVLGSGVYTVTHTQTTCHMTASVAISRNTCIWYYTIDTGAQE